MKSKYTYEKWIPCGDSLTGFFCPECGCEWVDHEFNRVEKELDYVFRCSKHKKVCDGVGVRTVKWIQIYDEFDKAVHIGRIEFPSSN